MLSEEWVRNESRHLRLNDGVAPFALILGRESWHQEGLMIGGLPVKIIDAPEGFAFAVVQVEDPWLACTELGME